MVKVLVVEDEHMIRLDMEQKIKQHIPSAQVQVASNRKDAFTRVMWWHPDVVLSDLHLGSEYEGPSVGRTLDDAIMRDEQSLRRLIQDIPAAPYTETLLSAIHPNRRRESFSNLFEQSGTQLLMDIARAYPETIRFACSGYGLPQNPNDIVSFYRHTGIDGFFEKPIKQADYLFINQVLQDRQVDRLQHRLDPAPLSSQEPTISQKQYDLKDLTVVKLGGSAFDLFADGRAWDGKTVGVEERNTILKKNIEAYGELQKAGGVIIFLGGGRSMDHFKLARQNNEQLILEYKRLYGLSDDFERKATDAIRRLPTFSYRVNAEFLADAFKRAGINAEINDNLPRDKDNLNIYLENTIPIMYNMRPYNPTIPQDQSDTMTIDAAVRLGTQRIVFVKNVDFLYPMDPMRPDAGYQKRIRSISAAMMLNENIVSRIGGLDHEDGHLMETSGLRYMGRLPKGVVYTQIQPVTQPPTPSNIHSGNYSRIESGKGKQILFFENEN